MNNKSYTALLAVFVLSALWVGCGDDNPASENNDNNKWKTKDDMSSNNSSDMSQNDMTTSDMSTPDMIADMASDLPSDMPPVDMSDMVADMQEDLPVVDMDDPDMVIADPFIRSLTAQPFVGIFELPAQNSMQSIGIAVELAFNADMTVEFRQNGVRKGNWQKLNDGKVYVYDLPNPETNMNENLTFESVVRDDKVVGLQLALGMGRKFTLEPKGQTPPDYTGMELQGRWQSLQKHTNRQGNVFHLALRVDGQLRYEYGVVGRDNVFRSIFQESLTTMTFFDKRSFWYTVPPTSNVDIQPIAGQLLRDVDGSVRMFAPVGEKDDAGMDQFYIYELRKVNQFMFRPGR